MENEEQDVLIQFQLGSMEAFETLFRMHQRAVYGWILRIVRNAAAAEDVTVETFWRIHKAHARFEPRRGFAPWARRIASHAALDWLRAELPARETDSEMMVEDLAAPAAADAAVTAEIRAKTALAFGRLPPKLRIAATLAVVEELPAREVADALGISIAAVKVRVFRALRLLRKDLQGQGMRP
jgi:RNA polymerase sigma-70 factor (ECF subfamily)